MSAAAAAAADFDTCPRFDLNVRQKFDLNEMKDAFRAYIDVGILPCTRLETRSASVFVHVNVTSWFQKRR